MIKGEKKFNIIAALLNLFISGIFISDTHLLLRDEINYTVLDFDTKDNTQTGIRPGGNGYKK
jgi:hypothetical protein